MALLNNLVDALASRAGWKRPRQDEDGAYRFRLENGTPTLRCGKRQSGRFRSLRVCLRLPEKLFRSSSAFHLPPAPV